VSNGGLVLQVAMTGLDFQISTDATSLPQEPGPMWINWISLRLTQLPPVRWMETLPLTALPFHLTLQDFSIPSGAGFLIRWNDFNATGADDGLAIDDFFYRG